MDESTTTPRPQGHKLSIGLLDSTGTPGRRCDRRPALARNLDAGRTLEVTRLATEGSPNACSTLDGAAWRTTPAQGCRQLITYTQTVETGASSGAAGFRLVANPRSSARMGRTLPTAPKSTPPRQPVAPASSLAR